MSEVGTVEDARPRSARRKLRGRPPKRPARWPWVEGGLPPAERRRLVERLLCLLEGGADVAEAS